jgi:hypothetical protein
MPKRSPKKIFAEGQKRAKPVVYGPPGPAQHVFSALTEYDARDMAPISNFFGTVSSNVPLLSFALPVAPMIEFKSNETKIEVLPDDLNEDSENDEESIDEGDDSPNISSSTLEPPKPHRKAKERAPRHDRSPPKMKKFLSARATRSLQSYINERLSDFPNETFVGGTSLFCEACREELGSIDRPDVVRAHTLSKKHVDGKQTLFDIAEREKEIKKYLVQHAEPKMISQAQQVYRLRVAEALLYCGIPFETLGHESSDNKFRALLETNGFRLGTESLMSDQVTQVKEMHFQKLIPLFRNQPTSHIFDGSCVTVNSLCMVSRTLHLQNNIAPERNVFTITQKLTDVSLIDQCPNGASLAGYINASLHELGVSFKKVAGFISDRCGVNYKAIERLDEEKIFPNSVHLPCYAHSLNLVGKKLQKRSNILHCYLKHVNIAFGHSSYAKMLFFEMTGESAEKHTIRWFSEFIQAVQHLRCFNKLLPFWAECEKRKIVKESARNILELLKDPEQQCRLALQMAVYVDYGLPLLNASNFLEGDGFLSPFAYDCITSLQDRVQRFAAPENHPNVTIVCDKIAEAYSYARNSAAWKKKVSECFQEAEDAAHEATVKFNRLFVGNGALLRSSLDVFRASKLLQPCLWETLRSEVEAGVLRGFKHLTSSNIDSLKRTVADYVIVAKGVSFMKSAELLQWWANAPPVLVSFFP